MKSFLEGEYSRRSGGPRLVLLAAALALAARAPSQNSSSSSPPSSLSPSSSSSLALSPPVPSVSLPPDLDRVLRDYERAWSARDSAGLADLFAEDGFVLQGGRPPVRGRAAIRAAYEGHGGAPLFLRAFAFGVEGATGWIVGGYAGKAGEPDDGKFTLTLRKGPGRPLDDRVGHGQREPASAKAAVNPLVDDRDLDFLLYEVHDAASLLAYSAFSDHAKETFDAYIGVCRRFARETPVPGLPRAGRRAAGVSRRPRHGASAPPHALAEARRARRRGGVAALRRRRLAAAAHGRDGRPPVRHGRPAAPSTATRGSRRAPRTSSRRSEARRSRRRTSRGSTRGAGRARWRSPSRRRARASRTSRRARRRPATTTSSRAPRSSSPAGTTTSRENVVHMVLARIDGAPAGIRGVSLFLVPKNRLEEGAPRPERREDDRDSIHKVGWRALPSVVLGLGEAGDCRGWLVGEAHQGVPYMFQMMNAARISVGADAVATASVAYQESLAYARTRAAGPPRGEPRSAEAAGPDHRARGRAPDAPAPEGDRGRRPLASSSASRASRTRPNTRRTTPRASARSSSSTS